MRLGRSLRAFFLAGALLGGVAPIRAAWGQSASMAVTTTVSGILISIAGLQGLQFGAVVPATPSTIDPQTSASAGKFEVHGQGRAEFTFSLALPTVLRTGAGPHTLPITFGATSACERNRDQQNQCSYYDPATVLTARIRNKTVPNNTYYVWLGGTVSPAAGQFPGVYTATVTATVAYTGN